MSASEERPVCPVRGCGQPCREGRYLCVAHWEAAPAPLKKAVMIAAWREKDGPAHRAAVAAMVRVVSGNGD